MVIAVLALIACFSVVNCTIYCSSNIGDGVNSIIAFSTGEIHVTIVYGSVSNDAVQRIDMYNASTNIMATLTSPTAMTLNGIRELKGANSAASNTYVLQSPTGSITTNNFTTPVYSWSPATGDPVSSCFGATADTVYQQANLNGNCVLRIINLTPLNTVDQATYSGFTCGDMTYNNLTLYFLVVDSVAGQANLYIFNTSNMVPMATLNFPGIDLTISPKFIVEASAPFFCVAIGRAITVYYSSNYTVVCSLNFNENINDMKTTDHWIYVALQTIVEQYDIGSCIFFGNYSTPAPVLIETHEVSSYSYYTRIFLLAKGDPTIQVLVVEDRYICAGGCTSCIDYYGLDGGGQCFYTGFIGTFSTSPTPMLPNTTNQMSSNSTICFVLGLKYCEIYCDYKCGSCSIEFNQCQSCSYKRSMKGNSKCETETSTTIATIAFNTINTFRPSSIQFLFFLLDNFEIHQYHSIDYGGIFGNIIKQINYMESMKWSLLSLDYVLDWTKHPYLANSTYNSYTNYRFLEVERRNALLFQTTKAYYTLYIPLVFLVFLLLNRLFYLTRGFVFSQPLRVYSFWLHFLVIVLVSDSTKLAFLSLNYLQMLFAVSFWIKFTHFLTITAIGMFILFILCVFFMSSYFYGDLCKYFLFNLFRIPISMSYAFVRYSLKPLIQVCVHVFLFRSPKQQLLCLAIFETIFVIISITLQVKYQIFRCKLMFLCDILLSILMILVTFLNCLKYFYFSGVTQIINICQSSLEIIIAIMMAVIAFLLIHPLISTIISLISYKNAKKNQNITTNVLFQPSSQNNSVKQQVCEKSPETFILNANEDKNKQISIKSKKKEIFLKITEWEYDELLIRHRKIKTNKLKHKQGMKK